MFMTMRQLDEAYRLRNGLPGVRRFSNSVLASATVAISQAARIAGTPLSDEEQFGPALSAAEQEIAGISLPAWCVTVTPNCQPPEQLRVNAIDSCSAAQIAMNLLYPDLDSPRPRFGMKVEVKLVGRGS